MASSAPRAPPEGPYECIHCSLPVPSLYVTYKDPSNTSLLACPHPACRAPEADVYQSNEFAVVLLDLLLLKPEVYRHLLRNRGGKTKRERKGHWASETARMGAVVVGVDALVRCIDTPTKSDVEAVLLFARTVAYCLIETLSLLFCIALSALVLRPPRASNRLSLSDFALIPLTLFYASLPLVFTLLISSLIWRAEYLPSPASYPSLSSSASSASSSLFPAFSALLERLQAEATSLSETGTGTGRGRETGAAAWIAGYSRANLKSGLAQVGRARGWASEAVLRKGVGGGSAVVGFSAVLGETEVHSVLAD
ncbi:hypothetical protein JCM10213v2_008377 [Rhodosporidiobolus nylandii]